MRIYRRGFTLTLAFLALAFALSLVAWNGSANQSSSPQEASKQETTPENDIPVLDLKHAEATGSDQLKGRKRRSELGPVLRQGP